MAFPDTHASKADGERGLRILAKSVYRELRTSGYSEGDVVGFTNALLELVASEMRETANADSPSQT